MAVSLATMSFGQRLDEQYEFGNSLSKMTEAEAKASNEMGQQVLANTTTRGGGGAGFCEDFSNGFDGNNPYGAWTFEDSGDNTIWQMADAASPAGEWSNNAGTLASNTAANGWVIFDCDKYNTVLSPDYVDVIGYLTSPVIDMSEMNAPVVEWQHYYRYCCFSATPLTLEVTADGGENWTIFSAHGNFAESANSGSPNPLITGVDISCVAANELEVQFRFAYNSSSATGYSHYFWGLDDICLYDNEIANDLEVQQVTNGDIYNWWEYRVTPMEQRISEAEGGMVAGTVFRNNGVNDQTNCVITIDILDDAMSVVHTYASEVFDIPANNNSPVCPNQANDTLYSATGWEPGAAGTYYVRSTISSDQVDSIPDNSMMEKMIIYSDAEYGHDDENNLNVELSPREDGGEFDPTGYANWYHCPNEGSVAYGITVVIGNSSDQGAEFEARLYRGTDDSPYDPNSAEFQTNSYWWLDQGFTGTTQYFPFDFEQEMDPMHPYFAGIMNETFSEFELTCMATSNTDTDNSTLIYERSGGGDYIWFGSQTPSPSVRLIFAAWVGVEELGEMNGIDLNQNIPNPATGNTLIPYNLEQPTMVRFEIRDLQGRLMEVVNPGMMPTGQHQFDLNISSYAAGLYTYTLITDADVRLTRRMTVR